VLGLILGIGVALLLDRFDRRIREPDELEEASGLPVLGLVPRSAAFAASSKEGAGAGEISMPRGEAEAFRMLRARMRYFNVDREVRTVLVTSASAAEGKTTIALNLAAAAAASGSRVLLIEADLRRPTLTTRMGDPQYVGLSEVLSHSASLESALRHVNVGTAGSNGRPWFSLITAGFPPPNPSELIESRQMEELLAQLAPNYDLVVIDTPPLLVVSDAIPLIGRVDGVLVVSMLGQTTRDAAKTLGAQLKDLKAPVLGVVANGLRGRAQSYYYGYEPQQGMGGANDGSSSAEGESSPRLQLPGRRR
jgi:polysaccharide biosynthesis transport protein